VPKTIDNDLAYTDHCPGYGSVAKYTAVTAMEAGRDTESLYTADTATVMEAMGRNAGWIAASSGLARRVEEDAPHLVYVPEAPFSLEQFVADVKACLKEFRRCFIVAGEGIRDERGRHIAEVGGAFGQDPFGHRQLGGAGQALRQVVEKECGVKCRYNNAGTSQRNAMHFASATDVQEAYLAGAAAVKAAMQGVTGKMVSLVRQEQGGYACTTGLVDLGKVANAEKPLPREFINAAGNGVTEAFLRYARPLIAGTAELEIGPDGLPVYARLTKHLVPGKTARQYAT
jgi:6-phosphofructokinase 1